mmetsp:Transcript_47389/g.132054  ORF Transcript_47389/g.132054 Transcript_47389/m.132054 type:complete len:270 (-) Transcript_47389:209-1018(-)
MSGSWSPDDTAQPALGDATEGGCTLMLRGIGKNLTQEEVKRALDEAGLCGSFSYVYVPRAFARGPNLGYAFVRFRHAERARACRRICNGRLFGQRCRRGVQVVVARSQVDWCDTARGRRCRRRRGAAGPLICDDPPRRDVEPDPPQPGSAGSAFYMRAGLRSGGGAPPSARTDTSESCSSCGSASSDMAKDASEADSSPSSGAMCSSSPSVVATTHTRPSRQRFFFVPELTIEILCSRIVDDAVSVASHEDIPGTPSTTWSSVGIPCGF